MQGLPEGLAVGLGDKFVQAPGPLRVAGELQQHVASGSQRLGNEEQVGLLPDTCQGVRVDLFLEQHQCVIVGGAASFVQTQDLGVGQDVLGLVAATVIAPFDHVRGGWAGWNVDDEVAPLTIGGRGNVGGDDGQRGSGVMRATCSTFSAKPLSGWGSRKKVRFSLSSPIPMISVPPSTANEATSRASSLLSPFVESEPSSGPSSASLPIGRRRLRSVDPLPLPVTSQGPRATGRSASRKALPHQICGPTWVSAHEGA